MQTKPAVEIEYCTGCRWMLRAAWFAQELLSTFESELASVCAPDPEHPRLGVLAYEPLGRGILTGKFTESSRLGRRRNSAIPGDTSR